MAELPKPFLSVPDGTHGELVVEQIAHLWRLGLVFS